VKLPLLDPTPGQILQSLHAFISFSIVMACILFLGTTALVGFYAAIGFALVKEFLWDQVFETTTFLDELKDFVVYFLAALAMLAWCYFRNVGTYHE
jgi:hypothetical protein